MILLFGLIQRAFFFIDIRACTDRLLAYDTDRVLKELTFNELAGKAYGYVDRVTLLTLRAVPGYRLSVVSSSVVAHVSSVSDVLGLFVFEKNEKNESFNPFGE